ncbi:MAG: sugar ABC transporter substrate-binding protein [bacterium]|nr:sugar ABC transporter substrate-binding protein [bacterium]
MQNKIRLIFIFLLLTSILTGCVFSGAPESDTPAPVTEQAEDIQPESVSDQVTEKPSAADMKRVGVAMPTSSSERWLDDGANMKAKLEVLGYEVDLQYAEDDIETQIEQINNMIENDADCLVIASIDSEALIDVLDKAKGEGIPVIAYDRLLMETDAISYYASFDNEAIGILIGRYVEEKKDLKKASRDGDSYSIEFFMGSPDDNNALYLYNGMMEVLQPYLEGGTLVCRSGLTSFEDTCILRWSQETAQERCSAYLDEYYTEDQLDIACSAFDGFAYGIKTALLSHDYEPDRKWPLITGQDAERLAVKNIMNGSQTMTIYKDTRVLSSKCVTMVQAVLEGAIPEINDTHKYSNGKMYVPSFLCTSITVDVDNYEKILIDGGYYTKVQLMK